MLAIHEARGWHATVVLPLVHMALLAAAIVTPIVLWIGDQRYQTGWFEAAVVAGVLLVGALLERERALWNLFQGATGWLVALAAVVVGQRSAIWSDTIWDLRIIIPGLAALGAWCIAWSGLRIGVARLPKLSELTLPAERWPRLDDGVRAALVVAALLVACHALHPGVALELGWLSMPLNRPLDQSTFAPALARGGASWLALSAIIAAIGATLYERDRKWPWGELLTVTLAIPLLAASSWNEQLAGASAARWTVAFYAAFWAVPALLRARLLTRSASWPTAAVESVRNGSLAFG
ncbi:MAG TPA: hypothetical protein PLV92_27550, partial [Pirellulaceae bacterium]|nr:hypothetical protein [Pirellulaceae bacterium]